MAQDIIQAHGERRTWGSSVRDTGIGKLVTVFDAVDANRTKVTLNKPKATTIIGFLVNYCATEVADAEAIPNLRLRIESDAYGMLKEEFLIAHGGGDSDANSEATPMPVAFIPFVNPKGAYIKGATFEFSATGSHAIAAGLDVGVTVVYSNYTLSITEKLMWLLLNATGAGGKTKYDLALAHTGGSEASLTSVVIPANKRTITGICYDIKPNGITEKDAIGGLFSLGCEAEDDFSPQEYVYPRYWNPALGTVAESSVHILPAAHYPIIYDLSGSEATITGKSVINVSAGIAPDVTESVRYI